VQKNSLKVYYKKKHGTDGNTRKVTDRMIVASVFTGSVCFLRNLSQTDRGFTHPPKVQTVLISNGKGKGNPVRGPEGPRV
jgi:hypothetical protein